MEVQPFKWAAELGTDTLIFAFSGIIRPMKRLPSGRSHRMTVRCPCALSHEGVCVSGCIDPHFS
jgi:hypothetical protein